MATPCSDNSVIYDYRMSRPKRPEDPEKIIERRVFAVLVRTLRAALGWSQKDLAEQLGLSVAAIAKLELSNMRLTPENHAALIKLFEKTGAKFNYSPEAITVALDASLIAHLTAAKEISLPKKF